MRAVRSGPTAVRSLQKFIGSCILYRCPITMTSNSARLEIPPTQAVSTSVDRSNPNSLSTIDMGEKGNSHDNMREVSGEIRAAVPSCEGISVHGAVSASSSISSTSAGVHAFGSLSKIEDDETFEGSPPLMSLAQIEDSPLPTKTVVANRKLPLISKVKRSVSEVEIETEVPESSTKSTKKARRSSQAGSSSACSKIGTNPPVLLAQPRDESVLNPIHCFVRRHIEVFEATEVEIQLPAPGRKNPIRPKQIGLRCIHCKTLSPRDRVKRAVCYPTSVGRVYNSVSDMKFDHFSTCKGLSVQDRQEFERLKEETKKGKRGSAKKTSNQSNKNLKYSSSTAQYCTSMIQRLFLCLLFQDSSAILTFSHCFSSRP